MDSCHLIHADRADQMPHVRRLFTEYAEWIGIDLCFQGFDRELAELPGRYAPPRGRTLLALHGEPETELSDEALAGCVALRPLDEHICEMKRLFVRPAFRGQGLGRRLALAVLDEARSIGYRTMRLDTLNTMTEAIALYKSIGFVEIESYYDNPIPCAVYMELVL